MGYDKKLHFWAALSMSVWGAVITLTLSSLLELPPVETGLAGSLAAGLLKEIYDALSNWWSARNGRPLKHTVDFMDIWWSWVGSFAGGILTATVML